MDVEKADSIQSSSDQRRQIWLITGCSTGFGRAIAEAALAAGHLVCATARDVRAIADLEADHCLTLPLDVTDPADIPAAVSAVAAKWGRIDVLVNNAGFGLIGAVEECAEEQVRRCVETNFFGALHLTRAVLPTMRAQGVGTVVNISAAAASGNYPGFGIYGAAKAALEYLSESLRGELAPFGIRVMVVQPGPFRTDFIRRNLERASASIPGYEPTSGKFLRLIETMDGRQPGDPAKAARAILAAVAAPQPPQRLVLGKYANAKASRRSADLEKERTAWEHIGLPTDFA